MSQSKDDVIKWAKYYYDLGYIPVPVMPGTKRPSVEWRVLQRSRPTDFEAVERMFENNPCGGVGLVTGAVSGLIVLDVDPKNGGSESLKQLGKFDPTPRVVTGSGGVHYYFKHPGFSVKNFAGKMPGLDLRGDGGFVVAPPTLHPDTKEPYVWRLPPGFSDLAEVPYQVKRLLDRKNNAVRTMSIHGGNGAVEVGSEILTGVGEGQRNSKAASLAGRYFSRGLTQEEVLFILLAWNELNTPPMGRDEVTMVVNSIKAKDQTK